MEYSEYERIFLWIFALCTSIFFFYFRKKNTQPTRGCTDGAGRVTAQMQQQNENIVFLQHINHEMRNPINAALGFSQIAVALCDNPSQNIREISEYVKLTAESVREFKTALSELEAFCKKSEDRAEKENLAEASVSTTHSPFHTKFTREAYVIPA